MANVRKILLILGHPAKQRHSFCEALADMYQEHALSAGHEVRRVNLAALSFDPILHEGYHVEQKLEPCIAQAQDSIRWAEHLVIVYPLWMLLPPALLKGFLERTITQSFMSELKANKWQKSARLIQTMAMPVPLYRLIFSAHGVQALKNMLVFTGISPVSISNFGAVENDADLRLKYLKRAASLGHKGS